MHLISGRYKGTWHVPRLIIAYDAFSTATGVILPPLNAQVSLAHERDLLLLRYCFHCRVVPVSSLPNWKYLSFRMIGGCSTCHPQLKWGSMDIRIPPSRE